MMTMIDSRTKINTCWRCGSDIPQTKIQRVLSLAAAKICSSCLKELEEIEVEQIDEGNKLVAQWNREIAGVGEYAPKRD